MAEENEEKKAVTDYVVNAVVGINNNMMDSWDYTFKKLGVFDDLFWVVFARGNIGVAHTGSRLIFVGLSSAGAVRFHA